MTQVNRQRRSLWLLMLLLSLSALAQPAFAKEVLKGVDPSENRVYIRTDGMACYFCAYGLERFFKKTGRIATWDMDMKAGIVEAVFVQGKPLVPSETLTRFVHNAGFTPRWIDAELVGSLEVTSDGATFLRIRETGERIPLEDTDALRGYLDDERQAAGVVRVRGRAQEDEDSPMRLAPEWIRGETAS